jgi:cobyric acid synthase
MLGESIADPYAVESDRAESSGLALLPVRTILRAQKTVRPVEAQTRAGIRFPAYEIHMGETPRPPRSRAFATLADGTPEGVRQANIAGTYLHGALESAAVLSDLLARDIPAPPPKQHDYDQLADWFDRNQRNFVELYL